MANDLNNCFLVGRLVRDPELRYTPNNVSVASFSIANNRSFVTGGEKREQVSYFDCVAFGKLGDIISQYARKGKLIGITGRLQQRSWDDQDGKKRSKVEIIVENFQFLDSRGSEQHSQEGTPASAAASYADYDSQVPSMSREIDNNPYGDDDVPF